MNTLNQNTGGLKLDKVIAWFATILITIKGLPILKNAIISFLNKLYEIFIQHSLRK